MDIDPKLQYVKLEVQNLLWLSHPQPPKSCWKNYYIVSNLKTRYQPPCFVALIVPFQDPTSGLVFLSPCYVIGSWPLDVPCQEEDHALQFVYLHPTSLNTCPWVSWSMVLVPCSRIYMLRKFASLYVHASRSWSMLCPRTSCLLMERDRHS